MEFVSGVVGWDGRCIGDFLAVIMAAYVQDQALLPSLNHLPC